MEPYPRREKILSGIILNDNVSQKLYLQWQDSVKFASKLFLYSP